MEGEEEEKEAEEGEKEKREKEAERRMSYPGDPALEDESLQYRIQGSFQQHRYILNRAIKIITMDFTKPYRSVKPHRFFSSCCFPFLKKSGQEQKYFYICIFIYFYIKYPSVRLDEIHCILKFSS